MCSAFPMDNAEMTLPKAERERLILEPSFKRTPDAPVFFWRSLPARSTRFKVPTRNDSVSPLIVLLLWDDVTTSEDSMRIVKMECAERKRKKRKKRERKEREHGILCVCVCVDVVAAKRLVERRTSGTRFVHVGSSSCTLSNACFHNLTHRCDIVYRNKSQTFHKDATLC